MEYKGNNNTKNSNDQDGVTTLRNLTQYKETAVWTIGLFNYVYVQRDL